MSFFAQHGLPIGLQLYTVHEALDADLDGTLAALRTIGYETVELASFHSRTPQAFARSLAAVGLRCRSAHIAAQSIGGGDPTLDGDLDALAEGLHAIGVETVVLPAFPIPPRLRVAMMTTDAFRAIGIAMTADDWRATADILNDKGAALAARGLRLAYHNHNFEFARLGDGTILAMLLDRTDPALVSFEMDVGWVSAAGASPLALFDAHPGRFRQFHVKDILLSTRANTRLEQDPADAGDGGIDWPALLPALHRRGVREFYIEREPPFASDPMTAVERCYRYLDALPDPTAPKG